MIIIRSLAGICSLAGIRSQLRARVTIPFNGCFAIPIYGCVAIPLLIRPCPVEDEVKVGGDRE